MRMDDNEFSQAVLPVAKGSLGVCSARPLALPTFLASAEESKNALSENLVESRWIDHMMKRLNDARTWKN